jgi:hypothetical protein
MGLIPGLEIIEVLWVYVATKDWGQHNVVVQDDPQADKDWMNITYRGINRALGAKIEMNLPGNSTKLPRAHLTSIRKHALAHESYSGLSSAREYMLAPGSSHTLDIFVENARYIVYPRLRYMSSSWVIQWRRTLVVKNALGDIGAFSRERYIYSGHLESFRCSQTKHFSSPRWNDRDKRGAHMRASLSLGHINMI